MAAEQGSGTGDTRSMVLDACLAVIEHRGFAGLTLDEVARSAGRSRATVYRHFPGGRDQLISETVTREAGRFLARVTDAMAAVPEGDLQAQLAAGLVSGHRALAEHGLLHRVLASEPEALFSELLETGPMLSEVLRSELASMLERSELRDGVRRDLAADYLTQMMLSHLGSPAGWDLDDPDQVRHLVRVRFAAGIVA